jgi:hypothetical protein
MKGKGERGNSDRGLWGKRKGVGGFWPKGLLPPLACAPVKGRGGALAAAAARRPPGHERGRREGEKEEGDEGVLLPHSPWVEAARGDGSTGGGGPVVVVLGGRRSSAQARGGGGRGEVRRPGERPATFIGGERRFGRGSSSSGSFNNSGGKNLAVDPLPARLRPGFAVDCGAM